MKLNAKDIVTVIIDIQQKLFPVIDNRDMLLVQTKKLIEGSVLFEIPLITTFQYIKGLGEETKELKESLRNATRIEKITFSCMDDEVFRKALERTGRGTVLIAGIESHICVQQTVLDLLEYGYLPVVVCDCIGSRNPYDKQIALLRMQEAGAVITTCEAILYEICQRADHQAFKALLKLIK